MLPNFIYFCCKILLTDLTLFISLCLDVSMVNTSWGNFHMLFVPAMSERIDYQKKPVLKTNGVASKWIYEYLFS